MSTEHNKAVVRRNFEELWNQRKLELAHELYAADSISLGFGGDRPPGPAGFQQLVQNNLASFPDLHMTIEQMVAEGDMVATVWVTTGTYQGGAPNVPASALGKRVTLRGVTVNRFKDGKIVEGFNSMDQLDLLRQLGVLP